MTSAATNACPNVSTWMFDGEISAASLNAAALAARTRKKPVTNASGSRRAAISGGSTALITAISAAAMNAEPTEPRSMPGTIAAARRTDAAATIQETTTRSGRNSGLAGSHLTGVPIATSGVTAADARAVGQALASSIQGDPWTKRITRSVRGKRGATPPTFVRTTHEHAYPQDRLGRPLLISVRAFGGNPGTRPFRTKSQRRQR